MAKSMPDERAQLVEASAAMFSRLSPTIAYLAVLVVAGLAGNVLILLVYCTRFKPSAIRSYILTMAAADLLACLLGLPGEVVDLRYIYTYPDPHLCRAFRTANSLLSLTSAFVLVSVALDRRAKICRPLKVHPPWVVKARLTACLAGAIAITVPVSILGGNSSQSVPGHANLTGTACGTEDKYVDSKLPKIYSALTGLVFVVIVAIMAVSYAHVVRVLIRHRRSRASTTSAVYSSNNGAMAGTVDMKGRLLPVVVIVLVVSLFFVHKIHAGPAAPRSSTFQDSPPHESPTSASPTSETSATSATSPTSPTSPAPYTGSNVEGNLLPQ